MSKLLLLFVFSNEEEYLGVRPNLLLPQVRTAAEWPAIPPRAGASPNAAPRDAKSPLPLSYKTMIGVVILNPLKNDRSVGRLNCWFSPAQSALVSGPIGTHDTFLFFPGFYLF
jgi:hypothetical protein